MVKKHAGLFSLLQSFPKLSPTSWQWGDHKNTVPMLFSINFLAHWQTKILLHQKFFHIKTC